MKLKDKVAIITGSARGIGKSIALLFAKEGANPVIVDVDLDEASKFSQELNLKGRDTIALKADVSSSASVQEMVAKVMGKYGHIDILVNNAGITRDSLLIRMKEEDWDKVLSINLKGTFNCTQKVSKIMMKQRSGKIVSIASVIGINGNVSQANYAASKGGIIAFTKTAAKEFGRWGINVNAVAPGYIQTPMTQVLADEVKNEIMKNIPLEKLGSPDDVANLVLFLSCADSDYITAEVVRIDGGLWM